MAIPWYSSEFSADSPTQVSFGFEPKERSAFDLGKNHRFSHLAGAFHYILIKYNNIFKREASPFSDSEVDEFNEATDIDDYAGHNLDHSGAINKAFLPMRWALTAVGRWPFRMTVQSVKCKKRRRRNDLEFNVTDYRSRSLRLTRVKNYDDSLWSSLWVFFGLTTAFTLFVLVMSTVSFFDFFLEWKLLPGDHWQSIEKTIFRDNLVCFLVVWGCLFHTTVSSFSLFFNRRRVVKILNFWNVAADELLFDEVTTHKRFLIVSNLAFVLFLVVIYFAFSSWNIRLVQDGAKLFGILAIRPLYGEEKGDEIAKWKLCVFGIITMLYVIYASRAFLIMFCFKCRILRSMFRAWNERLFRFLRKPDNRFNTREKLETCVLVEELECMQLLKDMTVLLKLVKQTDKVFATILQAYYGVQLLNMCFELYMLAKSGSEEFTRTDDPQSKKLEIITAVLTLCQNVYFFFAVSLDGSYVGEEAAKGQEALRRFHITPNCSRQKKYLIYNLTMIYNQPIVLTGGKYFIINRPFIITVLGAVLTYFVIIMQVEPHLQRADSGSTTT